MPVIEAPSLSEDDALVLVYAKVDRRRRHRRRLVRRTASGLAALVAGALVWSLVTTGPSQHRAVYAVPASLSQTQAHQVVVGLTDRYRALGYGNVHSQLVGATVRVDWTSASDPGAGVVARLGTSGELSLRPVLSTSLGACVSSGALTASSEPMQAPDPTSPDQCLQLGPAQMTDLAFTSATPVQQSGGWGVSFTVAAQDVAQFDQVNSADLGQALAILEDGQVLSAPIVHNAAFHGEGIISGHFDQVRAQALAVALRFGLPKALSVLSVS